MKSYDNFDNSFFIKLICIIAGIALVFVLAISVVGLLTQDKTNLPDDGSAETFFFTEEPPETTTPESEPEETEPADTLPKPPETTSETTESMAPVETEPPAPVITTRLGETEDMGQEYIDSLTFLGDSTTNGLKAYAMLKDGKKTKQVWTGPQAVLSLRDILTKKIIYPANGKEMLITDAAEFAKPEYLVITLGVEGVSTLGEADFKEQYTGLVRAVQAASPSTKIILQSIFPVSSDYTSTSKLNNGKIDAANVWVEKIAEETGVRFLNTASVLKGADGTLDPKYDNGGNGINLNDTGFSVVLNYIRTHGYK